MTMANNGPPRARQRRPDNNKWAEFSFWLKSAGAKGQRRRTPAVVIRRGVVDRWNVEVSNDYLVVSDNS